MKDSREMYRLQEVEGVAEAYSQAVWDEVRFRPERHDDRVVMMDHMYPTSRTPFFSLIYLASWALKLGLLIFGKLDDIHTLLWEQELRERRKEGR